ncbi:sugar phosphate isomerase/epimerase family protein [Alicyclobacillus sendaiensis]|uniref:Sugar phosphate isomerase/epimerase family protein n=1 Tax=Alicyclobacillus sendaiensis PA2 TaxID=3029425 RepID=A0ABT6XZR8_ALISE|nr:sugar phosphate isomerase/epimerase family protein [Alicyclobacillus sendaiensis]MDI9260297.1 sugar phosphate isomerase/epimerase family protein [Alicyclobacillus sendaiensis PA2]
MLLGCCVGPRELRFVRDAGFDYAELNVKVTNPSKSDAEWQAIRDELLRNQVPLLAFNRLFPPDMPIVGPAVDMDEIARYLDVAFARMADLGGQHVGFGAGKNRRVPDGFPQEEARAQLAQVVRMAGDLAARYGMWVHFEFFNRAETNLINTVEEAVSFVQELGHPRVDLLIDFYHLVQNGEPVSELHRARGRIGYVHVADEERKWPGSGSLPVREWFAALREIGYQGPISIECNFEDPVPELRQAGEAIRRLSYSGGAGR